MGNDLSDMLRQVMEDPRFGQMVGALQNGTGEGMPQMDPDKLMEKLPELMTMLGPMMRSFAQTETDGHTADSTEEKDLPEAKEPEKTETMAHAEEGKKEDGHDAGGGQGLGALAGLPFWKPGNRDKRNKLCGALKPYLSPARCDMMDRAMSALQLGEILGTVYPPKKE